MIKLTQIKRQLGIENQYDRNFNSGRTDLQHFYGRYSYAKEKAMEYCKDLMFELDGYGGAIINHNTFIFTYGFYYDKVDDETGEVYQNFCYITPSHNYTWKVD